MARVKARNAIFIQWEEVACGRAITTNVATGTAEQAEFERAT
jgi:hypothetical protein